MALKKTIKTPQGFEAVDAYHRVEDVRLSEKNQNVFSGSVLQEQRGTSIVF